MNFALQGKINFALQGKINFALQSKINFALQSKIYFAEINRRHQQNEESSKKTDSNGA